MTKIKLSLFTFAALILALTNTSINAQLLVENFNYTTSTTLTENGWTAHSGEGTSSPIVTSATISYPNYIGSGIGGQTTLAADGEDVNKELSASKNSGSVYAAFIVSINSASTGNNYFLHFSQSSGPSVSIYKTKLYVKKDASNKLAFGVLKGSTEANIAYTENLYSTETSYLIVIKYTFLPGPDNDYCNLYINPVIGQSEPEIPNISSTPTDNLSNDLSNISALCLRQASTTTSVIIDGIRVASTWSELFSNPSSTTNPTTNSGIYTIDGKIALTAEAGQLIEVYNTIGQRLAVVKATKGLNKIAVNTKGMVVVRTAGKLTKVIL